MTFRKYCKVLEMIRHMLTLLARPIRKIGVRWRSGMPGFSNPAQELKGGSGKCALSVGKSHARNPTKKTHHPKPTQTKPNHHIHRLSSAPHARGGPYVARVTCGTLVASHRKMRPHARHEARAPRRTYEHGAKRSRAHGNSNSSGMSSGAAAAVGSAPERPSLTGGVPSVSNAGVVGQPAVAYLFSPDVFL